MIVKHALNCHYTFSEKPRCTEWDFTGPKRRHLVHERPSLFPSGTFPDTSKGVRVVKNLEPTNIPPYPPKCNQVRTHIHMVKISFLRPPLRSDIRPLANDKPLLLAVEVVCIASLFFAAVKIDKNPFSFLFHQSRAFIPPSQFVVARKNISISSSASQSLLSSITNNSNNFISPDQQFQ